MKRACFKFLTVSMFLCLLFACVFGMGCTDKTNAESDYELTSYMTAAEATSPDNRILYLQPKTCDKDNLTAVVYGSVFDGETVLNIKQQEYTFKQIAGRVWVTNVTVNENYDGEVIIYARRRIIGKTLNVEYKTDIYGNKLTCEIGEGYGDVDWFQCFSYTYFAYKIHA